MVKTFNVSLSLFTFQRGGLLYPEKVTLHHGTWQSWLCDRRGWPALCWDHEIHISTNLLPFVDGPADTTALWRTLLLRIRVWEIRHKRFVLLTLASILMHNGVTRCRQLLGSLWSRIWKLRGLNRKKTTR